MKKLLFTILGLSFLSLNAQLNGRIANPNYPIYKNDVINPKSVPNNNKRDLGTGWFDYSSAYNDFNASALRGSVFFMQPDTNLNTVSELGVKNRIGFHVIGRANDPRDEVFGNNPVRFSKFNSYTWDSIAFIQFYIRNVDSMMKGATMVEIVDTAYIQYFLPSALDATNYVYTADPSKTYYAVAPKRSTFNWRTRRNTAAFKTDTIFLTKAFKDSVFLDGANSNFRGRGISAPVGATINVNTSNINSSVVAHTITFKPMKKPNLGDTGLAYNGSTWVNKYNMYAVRILSAAGVTVDNSDPMAINNTILTNFQVGFGRNFGIWQSYLPGTIFTNTLFDATQYHLTTQTLNVKNVDANGNGIGNIYPNPNNGSSEVFVPVKLTDSKLVTFTVRDITGKVVKTISSDLAAGDFDVTLNTEGLSKGIYSCTMTTNNYTGTTKFVLN